MVRKIIKKLDLYAYSFRNIYKRYINQAKCMYFMIKDEKTFHKYMTIWEKVNYNKKKLIVNLYVMKYI